MKKNFINNGGAANKIVSQLAAKKKKTILAVCLIVLMLFMWIKVLAKKGPGVAAAVEMGTQAGQDGPISQDVDVSFVKLPEIDGRNDSISRDFFNSNGWKNFTNSNSDVVVMKEVNVTPGDDTEKVIGRIAENLKLEAFIMGTNPRAYINDRIMSVGDVFPVRDETDVYECEVVLIENDSVVIKCKNAEVTLKLKKIMNNSN